jgi:putative peptidoglycan lipid II flippase
MRELIKNGTNLLNRRQTNILSAAFIIMITYAVSHLVGLLKTRMLISVFFGSKASLLDVYYAAFVIPDTLFQLLVIGSLSAAFIPVFTRLLAKKEEEAWYVAGTSLNLVLVIFILISAVIFIFAQNLSRLIAPGFNPGQISTMSSLLRVMLTAQIFFCISGFMTGVIQSHQRFLIPALAPVAYNLGIIAGIIFLSPAFGIFGPAIGVVIGAALHMAIQIPIAISLGFKFVPSVDLRQPEVREIIKLMSPRALALGIDQIEQFIAVILSSIMASGSLTIFNVAKLLYALPTSLFGVAIGQAALPALSRQSVEVDKRHYRQTLMDSLSQIAFLALPISTLFIVLRIPVVRLVFGAKSFPWSATIITGKTLAILAVSCTFSAMMQLIIRGFYALHDTKTPLLVGFFAAIFDVTLGVILVILFNFGVLGLAAAISLTTIIETIVLFWLLYPKLHADRNFLVHTASSFTKMIIASFITGVSLWIPMRVLDQFVFDTTRTLSLIGLSLVTSLIGFSVYFLLSYFFRVEELGSFAVLLKRLQNWRDIFFPSPAQEPLKEPVILSAPDQN